MKKIFAVFMALALILCAAPLSGFVDTDRSDFAIKASAANYSGKCGDNVAWSLNPTTGVFEISGSGEMFDDYYDSPWYKYRSNIKSVTIGDSVTSIGSSAFYNCSSLTSVTIGNSVTSIGDCAFYECSSLTSVTIGNSVTSIGGSAFRYCSSLTSVTIPDGVTSIGDYAFYACSSLTSVTIGNSVTSIGDSAFRYCSSLKSIIVSPNNKNYSNDESGVLFNKNKTELICYPIGNERTSYIIPDSVTSIGDYAFEGCSSLTSVTIPDSVTSIGDSAFEGCSSLTSVTIPDSVISIGDYAFYACSSLTSVTIGNSVTSIGGSAFGYCSSLKSIIVSPNNKNYSNDESGVLFNKNKTELICYPIGNERTSYIIPDSVTSIGDYAFYACSSLTSVTIGNSVTSIGDSAFQYCRNLTTVTIPDSVTSIGYYAFSGCSSLTSVTIPDNVKSVGNSAFKGCSGLKDIYFKGNKCSVYPSSDTIPEQTTIHGLAESSAYMYAMTYARTFVIYCDHSLETSFEMPSGCVTYGFKLVTCKNCDYKANEVIEPLGHKDTNADGKCDVCQVALGSAGGAADITPATPTIKVDTARIKAGKQVRVDVSIKNNPGLASLRLRIAYDPALRLVSVKDGEILGTAVHTPDYNKNPYTLTWENDLVTENITADGVIATLTFDVAENTPEGDYSVTVSYDKTDSDILDKDMNPVDFATVNGAVKVVDYTVGDVNGDNSVNTGDRMIISRYIADWNGYEDMIANLQAADLNGDGKINAADRMILSRLIAGWSGYDKYSQ